VLAECRNLARIVHPVRNHSDSRRSSSVVLVLLERVRDIVAESVAGALDLYDAVDVERIFKRLSVELNENLVVLVLERRLDSAVAYQVESVFALRGRVYDAQILVVRVREDFLEVIPELNQTLLFVYSLTWSLALAEL